MKTNVLQMNNILNLKTLWVCCNLKLAGQIPMPQNNEALRSMLNKIAQKLQSFISLLGTSPFNLSNLG
jgi:hypothetical protein